MILAEAGDEVPLLDNVGDLSSSGSSDSLNALLQSSDEDEVFPSAPGSARSSTFKRNSGKAGAQTTNKLHTIPSTGSRRPSVQQYANFPSVASRQSTVASRPSTVRNLSPTALLRPGLASHRTSFTPTAMLRPSTVAEGPILNIRDLKDLLGRERRRGSGAVGTPPGLRSQQVSPSNSRRGSIDESETDDSPTHREKITRRASNLPDQARHGLAPAQQNLNRKSLLPNKNLLPQPKQERRLSALPAERRLSSTPRKSSVPVSLTWNENGNQDEENDYQQGSPKARRLSVEQFTDLAKAVARHEVASLTVKRLISRTKDMQVEVFDKLTNEDDEGHHKKTGAAVKDRLRQKATNRLRLSRQKVIQQRLSKEQDPEGANEPVKARWKGVKLMAKCGNAWVAKEAAAAAAETMPAGMSLGKGTRRRRFSREEQKEMARGFEQANRLLATERKKSLDREPTQGTSGGRRSSRRCSVMQPLEQDQIEQLMPLHSGSDRWWKITEMPRMRRRFRLEHDKQILSDQFSSEFMTHRRQFEVWTDELELSKEDTAHLDLYMAARHDLEAVAVKLFEKRIQDAAWLIQTRWADKTARVKERQRKQEQESAVTKLQRAWRHKKNILLPVKRRVEHHVKVLAVAKKLQACFRGYAQRKKYNYHKELEAVKRQMTELQGALGPEWKFVVRTQAAIRGFLARKRIREQVAVKAHRHALEAEDTFSPSVDETMSPRDLCRSRHSTYGRSSTIGDWPKSLAERRRSMAARKSLKHAGRRGSSSARASVIKSYADSFAFEYDKADEGSLPSTRASTRTPSRTSSRMSYCGSMSPGHSHAFRHGRYSMRHMDNAIISELTKNSTDDRPPPRPDTVPLAKARPDSDASCPLPASRAALEQDLPLTPRRPHSSCASVYRLGRQIKMPSGPVRASSALRHNFETRAESLERASSAMSASAVRHSFEPRASTPCA